jgi:hypothetical protein
MGFVEATLETVAEENRIAPDASLNPKVRPVQRRRREAEHVVDQA